MKLLDAGFKRRPWRYIFQCAVATVVITAILAMLDLVAYPTLIASLGASAFLIFTMPKIKASRSRFLIGGYSIGLAVGAAFYFLIQAPFLVEIMPENVSQILFGGLAVGCAIFLMVITDTEHPPAAGITLGLIVSKWDYLTIIYVFSAIVLLCIARRLLQPIMENLL